MRSCCADFIGPAAVALIAIVEAMHASGKVVAADCHGPVGLIECKKADGAPLVAGLKVTGFSDAEEAAVGAIEWVASSSKSMEQAFKAAGGVYSAGENWAPNVLVDGNLITAQNPASAVACAQATLKALGASA